MWQDIDVLESIQAFSDMLSAENFLLSCLCYTFFKMKSWQKLRVTHIPQKTSSVLLYLETMISVNILCFLNSCFTTENINTSLEVATVKDRPAREGVEMSAKSADSEPATTAPCLLLPILLLRSKVTVSLLALSSWVKSTKQQQGNSDTAAKSAEVTVETKRTVTHKLIEANKPPGWWKLHACWWLASFSQAG